MKKPARGGLEGRNSARLIGGLIPLLTDHIKTFVINNPLQRFADGRYNQEDGCFDTPLRMFRAGDLIGAIQITQYLEMLKQFAYRW